MGKIALTHIESDCNCSCPSFKLTRELSVLLNLFIKTQNPIFCKRYKTVALDMIEYTEMHSQNENNYLNICNTLKENIDKMELKN